MRYTPGIRCLHNYNTEGRKTMIFISSHEAETRYFYVGHPSPQKDLILNALL